MLFMSDYKNSFNTFLQNSLNQEQRAAVTQKNGVLVVCAGAGSGKTRVITARMTNLVVNEYCDPATIVALTFTNKAAQEMKERIARFLPEDSPLPYVGTFHAYCLKLLKTNKYRLGLPEFSILDSDDQEKLLKKIINAVAAQKKITAKTVGYTLSELKNNAVNGTITLHEIADPLLQQIIRLYEHEKTISRCYDFDDLLLETLKLFKNSTEFKTYHHTAIRHILVDEYQDTNKVQHALLKEMAAREKELAIDSLCVVGDEDQSIYSWRGATITNILNFNRDFKEARSITIEQNYRSVQPILTAANTIIKHNKQRSIEKKLWSEKQASDRVRVLSCFSGYQEGEIIATAVKKLSTKTSLTNIAILYRSHYQSRHIEEALMRASIPYKIIGGIQFYERQEIKDLLAYVRLIANPFDRVSFMRVINTPARGLGDKFQELFFELWDKEPLLSYKEIITLIIDRNLATKIRQESLADFAKTFTKLSAQDTVTTALDTVIKSTQYLTYLKESHEPEQARTKIENVKELLHSAKALEERGNYTVRDFLDDVALLQEKITASEEENDCVRLMTLHAAKGLEFDVVLLAGFEDGILPSAHSLHEEDTIEEERRLLYVGITRARERLLITHARYRHTYGSMTDQRPSRFLRELPEQCVVHDDAAQLSTDQVSRYIESWISTKILQKNFGENSDTKIKVSQKVLDQLPESREWKKYQVVRHATFGTGIVETIEKKSNKVFLTVRFSSGIKKLDANFLE